MTTAERGDERPGLLRALWEHRLLTAACIAAFGLLGIVAGVTTDPGAAASATVGLQDPRTALASSSVPNSDVQTRYVADQAAFATSDLVLGPAARSLGVELGALRGRVAAVPQAALNTFVVSASGATPEQAVDAVDAVVASYRQSSAARFSGDAATTLAAIEAARAEIEPTLVGLDPAARAAAVQPYVDQAVAVRIRAQTIGDGVAFADPARQAVPGFLSRPEVRNGLVGVALGLVVASVLALARTDRPAPGRASGRGADDLDPDDPDDLDELEALDVDERPAGVARASAPAALAAAPAPAEPVRISTQQADEGAVGPAGVPWTPRQSGDRAPR